MASLPTTTEQSRAAARRGLFAWDGDAAVVASGSPGGGRIRAAIRRSLDFALAAGLLLVLVPLFVAVTILLKLASRGPVLYSQERVGRNGRLFRILKFRTMRVDAERETGPVWAVNNDPRCTALGGFLRRSSIDELPQLWNVVIGDMSLVGPRPERPFFVERFSAELPDYPLRHAVRPGITGWAQVNGWRGDTSIRERLKCDLRYVRNRSLWFDVYILWRTPRALLPNAPSVSWDDLSRNQGETRSSARPIHVREMARGLP